MVVRDGVQTSLFSSRWLGMERMDLQVGPIRLEVVEPLKTLRLRVDAPEHAVRADLIFTGRSDPVEEPRFVRRIGPRTLMDYTRMTQAGRFSGHFEVDGVLQTATGWVGARDRSWGVRPVGARDPQEAAPRTPPQFFWLWSPVNLARESLFFHVNDDEAGRAWNTRAVLAPDGADPSQFQLYEAPLARVSWRRGARHAERAEVDLGPPAAAGDHVAFTPLQEIMMTGLGYGHPTWAHGLNHGPLETAREDVVLATVDRRRPEALHVQALCDVVLRRQGQPEAVGRGVFEQLALGPHAPSGLVGLLDPAS
jgi:hypothetical protein